MANHRILLVDDDPIVRAAISSYLQLQHVAVWEAGTCEEAHKTLRLCSPDAALVDFCLPDGDGIELLRCFSEYDPEMPVIILTGQGTIEFAVRAMTEGARSFLTKPVELSALATLLNRELENRRLRQQTATIRSRQTSTELDPFLGRTPIIQRLQELACRIVDHDSPVLITGETGSGKGVLARWLHSHSSRSAETFMDLNCASLSREFLETELFGHERGAFTGAVTAKPGLLEVAHQGTVFLDEIGDMDLAVQAKLLKVLETRQFRRLGAVSDRTVDVRLIAATHRDLGAMTREGRFREDLYYRINIIPLRVPALRERLPDLPDLAHHMLKKIARQRGRGEMHLEVSAMQALQRYHWPGNLRELNNVLERSVLIADCNSIREHDLQLRPGKEARPSTASLELQPHLTLEQMQRKQIEMVLREESGNMEKTAQRLGIARSSLYNKIKRLQLSRNLV